MEIKIKIPERFEKLIGNELKEPEVKTMLSNAVLEKLRVMVSFDVVDEILKKGEVDESKYKSLVEEYRTKLDKRHGLA